MTSQAVITSRQNNSTGFSVWVLAPLPTPPFKHVHLSCPCSLPRNTPRTRTLVGEKGILNPTKTFHQKCTTTWKRYYAARETTPGAMMAWNIQTSKPTHPQSQFHQLFFQAFTGNCRRVLCSKQTWMLWRRRMVPAYSSEGKYVPYATSCMCPRKVIWR